MSMYEKELLEKLAPTFAVIRAEAVKKGGVNETNMAETFIIGITALVGVVADIRRIADSIDLLSTNSTIELDKKYFGA